jgi:4-hydroxythreonine-4-phosphate dehydrogenase
MNKNPIRVGITIGDINGVGMEVILKALTDPDVFKTSVPVIYASTKAVSFYKKLLELNDFNFNTIREVSEAQPKKVNVINCWQDDFDIIPGEKNANGGKYALLSMDAATADLKAGKIDVVVTAPINKDCVRDAGFKFPGHTEYFAENFGKKDVLMFMVAEKLRVGVVTGHVPLKNVAALITSDNVEKKLRLMITSLKQDFGFEKPKIAVLGLNPHAGDRGTLGNEEMEIILPVVEKLRSEGELVFGCYSADGFFGSANLSKFDGILSMYHDQGLTGFKSISFDEGVNFTAGLSIVRTSPDHGTAYDIAGRNRASEKSFRNAYYLACEVHRNRIQYQELTANPLKSQKIEKEKNTEE